MKTFRTNRSTGNVFVIPTNRSRVFNPDFYHIPKETRIYEKMAKSFGLRVRYQVLPLDKLKSRGFVDHEDIEGSERRKQYIREHMDAIPFIVVRGRENDIVDGNHRWTVFVEYGLKRAPVLKVMGSKSGLTKFEDFVQDFNKHPPWLKEKIYGKNPRTRPRTRRTLERLQRLRGL